MSANKTLLLIEDDRPSADLLVSYALEPLGMTVTVIDTLDAALRVEADLVLLDLRLPPEYDENASLARIVEFSQPVIVLTAMPDMSLEARSLLAGAQSFFHKFDVIATPQRLRDEITRLLA